MNDKAIITEAAHEYGIDPHLEWGVYGVESSYGRNPSRSSAGAEGPLQLEPATAQSVGVRNPHDLREAAKGAARYLAQFKGRGTVGMLSAYNAGPAGGLQRDYVNKVLAAAKTYGQGAGNMLATAPQPAPKPLPAQTQGFDQQGFQKAQRAAILGKLLSSEGGAKENPLFSSGLLTTKAPSAVEYTTGPRLPAAGVSASAPPPSGAAPAVGGKLGGFLPPGAELQMNRVDQGQDIKTNPGGAIVAPGDGEVVAVKSDPSGFGPDYPVVKFTSGPLAGTSWYLGHTHTALKAGEHFRQGQTLSHTGKGPGPVGNATVPGWAEIGLSSALGSGNMQAGRATERYLRGR